MVYLLLRLTDKTKQDDSKSAVGVSTFTQAKSPESIYILPAESGTESAETGTEPDTRLPREVVVALQARECRSFWVGDSNQVVQAWSFTPISGYELWPEARELLFADAEERKPVWHYRDPTGEGNDADIYYLHTDGLNLCVVASSTSL
ncbi:MAG: hypothetical protein II038_15885, partial [Lachnospiraceae bacterium]|nr:hypothetical protein [Lachnospiraceae bacterium]